MGPSKHTRSALLQYDECSQLSSRSFASYRVATLQAGLQFKQERCLTAAGISVSNRAEPTGPLTVVR